MRKARGVVDTMAYRWRTHGRCVTAACWSTCTFCLHHAWHFEQTLFRPLDCLWFTNISHYPGHHVVLIFPHLTSLCGALSSNKWLCTAIATMGCTKSRNGYSPPLCHKCFGTCHIEYSSASGCVSDMMVHIQIHLMYSDTRHSMVSRGMVTSWPPCLFAEDTCRHTTQCHCWVKRIQHMLIVHK
jgi:hypothetical protein